MPENFEMQADFSIFVRMDRGEIIIYRTADGETRLEVRMESDSVWLTQAQIARLFESTERLLSDMSTTFISRANWSGKQHVQKLHMFSMRGYGKCGV